MRYYVLRKYNKCTYFTFVVRAIHTRASPYVIWFLFQCVGIVHTHTFRDCKMYSMANIHSLTHIHPHTCWSCHSDGDGKSYTHFMLYVYKNNQTEWYLYATYVCLGSNICVLFLFICDNGHNARYSNTKIPQN